MAGLVSDLRFAARLLGKDRTFTAVAVLTLGLGIGAATAIFSVVHAVLLRPLPFPRADELVQYHTQFPDQGRDRVPLSAPELDDLARYARALVAVTGYTI